MARRTYYSLITRGTNMTKDNLTKNFKEIEQDKTAEAAALRAEIFKIQTEKHKHDPSTNFQNEVRFQEGPVVDKEEKLRYHIYSRANQEPEGPQ